MYLPQPITSLGPGVTGSSWTSQVGIADKQIMLSCLLTAPWSAGSNLADIQEDSRQQLPYIGPGADPNTGDHRYVFLLYKQASHDYTFPDMSYPVIPNRRNSDVKRFAIEKELELVAANYFICAAKEE